MFKCLDCKAVYAPNHLSRNPDRCPLCHSENYEPAPEPAGEVCQTCGHRRGRSCMSGWEPGDQPFSPKAFGATNRAKGCRRWQPTNTKTGDVVSITEHGRDKQRQAISNRVNKSGIFREDR